MILRSFCPQAVALAISVCALNASASAQENDDEGFSLILAEDGRNAWRINKQNGQVSFCNASDISAAPLCSPWGPDGEASNTTVEALTTEAETVAASETDAVEEDFGCDFEAPSGPPSGYYSGTANLSGPTLRRRLHNIVSNGVTKLSYRKVWDALGKTDEDPCNSDNVILIYTGRSQSKELRNRGGAGQNDMWAREHVWPKSHGFRSSGMAAYTDIHHLRPADTTVNSSRGHKDFADGGDPQGEANDTFRTSQTWEPRNSVKGDIARMMFYMVVRYEGGDGVPDLELVEEATDSDQPRLGYLCTLYSWHHNDPVNKWERRRNAIIHTEQGNRNPFIDNPRWVEKIWGGNCEADNIA